MLPSSSFPEGTPIYLLQDRNKPSSIKYLTNKREENNKYSVMSMWFSSSIQTENQGSSFCIESSVCEGEAISYLESLPNKCSTYGCYGDAKLSDFQILLAIS